MKGQFANRMSTMQRSFIREILKVTQDPNVISFAGGLPNPDYFPIPGLRQAADTVFANQGQQALQYAPTLGYDPLRQFITDRYRTTCGVDIPLDDILITNGSQQGLELIAKILIDPGDHVLLESPSYLGGIQAFSLYQPQLRTVPLQADGPDTAVLQQEAAHNLAKLFYSLPNFQNPTGITYSAAKRQETAAILHDNDLFFIEDDPYRELRFMGDDQPLLVSYGRDRGFLLGSFSKIIAPGFRMGWIVAQPELMEKLIIAKQATDLHSNYVSQLIIHRFLADNDLDVHIATIKAAYRRQRELMVAMIEELFPAEVAYTLPEGGMFLWLTFPPNVSAMALFEAATQRGVVFVPGDPFHIDGSGGNTCRLNFSNTDPEKIEVGMTRLSETLRDVMQQTTVV